MSDKLLDVSQVTAVHGRGTHLRRVLTPTSLEIRAGESLAVVGPSGAGKSTLAEIVLGLRRPEEGTVQVTGKPWCGRVTRPRRQQRHLVQGVPQDPAASFVPHWTIRRSIELAVRRLTGERTTQDRLRRAAELVHLDGGLLEHRPSEVSGGQLQRAALARALAVGPAVLVADEPTSALDPATARSVATALLSSAEQAGVALLLVTHDPFLAARCDHTLTITRPPEAEEPKRNTAP